VEVAVVVETWVHLDKETLEKASSVLSSLDAPMPQ
jgi:hypothetical protein